MGVRKNGTPSLAIPRVILKTGTALELIFDKFFPLMLLWKG